MRRRGACLRGKSGSVVTHALNQLSRPSVVAVAVAVTVTNATNPNPNPNPKSNHQQVATAPNLSSCPDPRTERSASSISTQGASFSGWRGMAEACSPSQRTPRARRWPREEWERTLASGSGRATRACRRMALPSPRREKQEQQQAKLRLQPMRQRRR